MNKFLSVIVFLFGTLVFAADNEVYISQSGATFNADIEQMGSGNIIGGTGSTAGSMTALDLDGATMTLDINMIGSTNKFLGDIWADNYTGFFEFDGSSNIFNMKTDETNDNTVTYDGDGYAGGYFHLTHDGGSRTFNIDQASTIDNDWLKVESTGSSGTVCINQNDQGTGVGC